MCFRDQGGSLDPPLGATASLQTLALHFLRLTERSSLQLVTCIPNLGDSPPSLRRGCSCLLSGRRVEEGVNNRELPKATPAARSRLLGCPLPDGEDLIPDSKARPNLAQALHIDNPRFDPFGPKKDTNGPKVEARTTFPIPLILLTLPMPKSLFLMSKYHST